MPWRRLEPDGLPDWDQAWKHEDLVPQVDFVVWTDPEDVIAGWLPDALPCYEVVYVLSGRLRLRQGESYAEAAPGDAFVIPPRLLHHEETPPGETTEVIFVGVVFRGASGRRRAFPMPLAPVLHLGRGHAVEHILRRILGEVNQRRPGYQGVVRAAVVELFCELARATEEPVIGAENLLDEETLAFGARVRHYLDEHYAEPLKIDDLARRFCLSRQYFTRLFRQASGQTPHSYLTHVRLRHATALLADRALTIKEVAARVGFDDAFYFARCFKCHTGLTPSQYREGLQEHASLTNGSSP